MTSVNIWKVAIVYDELTINERQKKDTSFVDILDQVRRGSATQDSLECLKKQVISGTAVDKYIELCRNGSPPVCLFPTRKAGQDFNQQMLSALDAELQKLCVLMKLMRLHHHVNGLKKLKKS